MFGLCVDPRGGVLNVAMALQSGAKMTHSTIVCYFNLLRRILGKINVLSQCMIDTIKRLDCIKQRSVCEATFLDQSRIVTCKI